VIVLGGALAILVAGIVAARAASAPTIVTPIDPGTLVLGLVGVALACAAFFVNYDGFSSLWSEVGEGESAEFFLEPFVIVVAALVAVVVVLQSRPQVAAGILVAAGGAGVLHFLGVLVAAWRAIGEVGDVGSAGVIGVLGCLLIAGAGAAARR